MLYETGAGKEIREGRVRIQKGGDLQLDQLGRFVLTGQGKVEMNGMANVEAITPEKSSSGNDVIHKSNTNTTLRWQRIATWSLAGVAVALATGAVAEQIHKNSLQKERDNLTSGPMNAQTTGRYHHLNDRIDSAAGWRTGMALGAVAAAAGSGVLFYLQLAPSKSIATGQASVMSFALAIGGQF